MGKKDSVSRFKRASANVGISVVSRIGWVRHPIMVFVLPTQKENVKRETNATSNMLVVVWTRAVLLW